MWKDAVLGNIADMQYGYTATANDEPIGPKFLRITDIVPDQIDWRSVPYCEIDEQKRSKYKLINGDIVVARTGATAGYAKLIRDSRDAVFASYLIRIRPKTDDIAPEYLGRLIESIVFKRFVQQYISGGAQPQANAPVLKAFRFRYPSRKVQSRVVTILSAYDDLIENNRRRIQLLDEAARLLYREWFVYLRFPGHEHVPVHDGVPEGWVTRKIGDIADTVGGGTPSTKVPEYWDNGDVTWFVPKDLANNGGLVLLDSDRKITNSGLRNSSAKLLPPNTILMTSRASIGYFGLFDGKASTNQGFISIIPHDENLRMYVLHNLLTRVVELEAWASGSTFMEINKTSFRNLSILIPDPALFSRFNSLVSAMIAQERILKKQIKVLTQARDLLLPRLMNGEILV